MTNEVYIVTNSVVTSLDVLKQINDMYSTEFTRLLTVMGLLVGFGAVVLPLWFQFREAKARRAEMQAEFRQFFEQIRTDLEADLQKKFAGQTDSMKKEMGSLTAELNKKIAEVAAVSAHAQMKIAVTEKNFTQAAETGLTAIRGWCICSDHSNLLRILEYINTTICPNLKKEDLEQHEYLSELFEIVEKELIQENKTGFLHDKLAGFKMAKKEIRKR